MLTISSRRFDVSNTGEKGAIIIIIINILFTNFGRNGYFR